MVEGRKGGKFDPLPFRRIPVVDRAFPVFAFVTAIFHVDHSSSVVSLMKLPAYSQILVG